MLHQVFNRLCLVSVSFYSLCVNKRTWQQFSGISILEMMSQIIQNNRSVHDEALYQALEGKPALTVSLLPAERRTETICSRAELQPSLHCSFFSFSLSVFVLLGF